MTAGRRAAQGFRAVSLLAAAASSSPCLLHAEKLVYGAEWRFLDAGKAELIYGPPGARLTMATAGLADTLYAVRNSYSVTFDATTFCAASSATDAREAKRHRQTTVTYAKGKAEYLERDMKENGKVVRQSDVAIPPCVHDLLAALQVLRRKPAHAGENFTIPVSDGRKSAAVRVEVQEKETIRTPAGVFPCMRYEAFVFHDVIYRRKARLLIWFSEDHRRLPVQIQVKMPFWIGSVTLQLEKEEPD